jgi:hypothetical protein
MAKSATYNRPTGLPASRVNTLAERGFTVDQRTNTDTYVTIGLAQVSFPGGSVRSTGSDDIETAAHHLETGGSKAQLDDHRSSAPTDACRSINGWMALRDHSTSLLVSPVHKR